MDLMRRDVLTGAAGLAAAAVAWGLTPRRRLDLMQGTKLKDIVPERFGHWSARASDDLVQPKTEGTLAAKLYSDTLPRVYRHARNGTEVMVLMAYGSTQSDLLQLHRPESCYPAFGYSILQSATAVLRHRRGSVAVRELLAQGPARAERILYWTRIGRALPLSARQQQLAKLELALEGYVADGLLARFSVISGDFAFLSAFAAALLDEVAPTHLAALVGS